MFEKKKKLDEEELEDTKVAEEVTPGGIEVPKEEGAKEVADLPTPEKEEDQCEVSCEKVSNDFYSEVTLSDELIETKSIQEITNVLDAQLRNIREAAIRKIHRIKN